jgi:hypothetical protein
MSSKDFPEPLPRSFFKGSALNILPYDYGLELGFNWDEQRHQLPTGGLLQGAEAYAVLIKCIIGSFTPIDLAFAWVNKPSNELRTLLGQINFFNHFRVIRLNLFDHPLNASLTPVALYGKENEGYDYDRG